MTLNPKNQKENLLQYFLLAFVFSIGFFGYVMKTIDWFRAIPGDLLDARFNSVILEHLFLWLKGIAPNLWSPGFFYPYENVLAFSDNHFGSGWSYVLFRLLGFEREQAFISWFIVGNTLNFWVSFYVYRKLGFSIIAASVAAFIYTFGLPALAKEAHAQLLYRFAIPLSFLSIYRFFQTKQIADLSWSIVWLAIQFYSSIYLGVFLIYLLLAMSVAHLAIERKSFFLEWPYISRVTFIFTLCIFIFSISAISLLLYKYQAVSTEYGFDRSINEIKSLLPTPLSYLIADRSLVSGWIGDLYPQFHMRQEHQMFFGVGVLILTFMGCLFSFRDHTNNKLGRIAFWTLIILVVLTISIKGYSLYRLLLYLPGIGSVRAVSRIVLVMLLPVSVLVAITIDYGIKKFQNLLARRILILFLIGLIVCESIFYRPYSTHISKWVERQNQIKKILPDLDLKNRIIFVTGKPSENMDQVIELDAMILSQDLHLPTLNGYSGNFPSGHYDPNPCIDFQNRLNSYSEHSKNIEFQITDLMRRVLILSPYVCPVTPAMMTNQAVDTEIASNLRLQVEIQRKPTNLHVIALISNISDKTFSTLSKKGPIRLTWRFVPIDQIEKMVKEPGWDPRLNLHFALEKDQTAKEVVEIALPTKSGRYRFEMTLVQDGVAWFHEKGMSVASEIVDIP